jgi:hypothetical protein
MEELDKHHNNKSSLLTRSTSNQHKMTVLVASRWQSCNRVQSYDCSCMPDRPL